MRKYFTELKVLLTLLLGFILLTNKSFSQNYLPLELSIASLSETKNFASNNALENGLSIKINDSLLSNSALSDDYISWDSEKHFGIAVGELALVELVPWVLSRYLVEWEDPADNWAVVGSNAWWDNLNEGWEYDVDNFTTNFFAHPYHGNLYFNVGRTNGYNFWESTAWAFTGSALWEFFGEKERPAINDWVNTGINGINLGEMTYRLSTLITDNTASGSERLWSEIFGTLVNPVRGFNRIISGEVSRTFPNPEWRKPSDFLFSLNAGVRRLDKNGSELVKEGVEEGIFGFDLNYGNPFKAKEPFSNFRVSMVVASGLPHLNKLESSGYLAGLVLKDSEKIKHRLNCNLEYGYYNIYKQDELDSSKYDGILFGATSIYPHLLSSFDIWDNSKILTQLGINGVIMGATPNDYFYDELGRNYDFGPGVGTRLVAVLRSGIWDYVKVAYYAVWIWTMSEPAESRHHIHNLAIDFQFPLNSYFAIGIGANIYWRNSYYDYYEDINKKHPAVRFFFTTALL